jgi:hypothetical protein
MYHQPNHEEEKWKGFIKLMGPNKEKDRLN